MRSRLRDVTLVLLGFIIASLTPALHWPAQSLAETKAADVYNLSAGIKLFYADGDREVVKRPVALQAFRLGSVRLAKPQWINGTAQTDGDGFYQVAFTIPKDNIDWRMQYVINYVQSRTAQASKQ